MEGVCKERNIPPKLQDQREKLLQAQFVRIKALYLSCARRLKKIGESARMVVMFCLDVVIIEE